MRANQHISFDHSRLAGGVPGSRVLIFGSVVDVVVKMESAP
jgi:hypothetical protein